MPIDDYQVEHLSVWKHLHTARRDLAAKRLITTKQELLTGLSARIKRARHLRTAERAIRKKPAVFACERYTLFDALIDDQIADFSEPINVRFTRAEIAALNRVVE